MAKTISTSENVAYYHNVKYSSIQQLYKARKMHGVKRVIAFCILIVILPATLIVIPLYLRHSVFADFIYPVAESDIIEIRDGISSIFCEKHSLHMNSTFNAFQLKSKPEISTKFKHIRLKKSMTLPDDTLEYWGFYLLKGAVVRLKVCSRYDGSKILIVQGDRNFKTCGLLDNNNNNKAGAHYADKGQVTFGPNAELVVSDENDTNTYDYNRSIVSDVEIINKNNHKDNQYDDVVNDNENHGKEDLSDDNDNNYLLKQNSGKMNRNLGNNNKNTKVNKTDSMNNNSSNSNISSNQLSKSYETGHVQNTLSDVKYSEQSNNEHIADERIYRHRRHNNRKSKHYHRKKKEIMKQLYEKTDFHTLNKRDTVYDAKIAHGGNALNFTERNESNSVSSFENSLVTCYGKRIILIDSFKPSSLCTSVDYLANGTHMEARHDVKHDGYYYYIFYSDNDLFRNDIHAVFDIYKPTYEYMNITDSKGCLNSKNCTFPINFLSDEIVVVEVPTRDGIEHEEDDITYLISTCHPRMAVYVIFPISALILILSCSFM